MNTCTKVAYLLKCARFARHLSTALSNGPNFYELLGVSPKATAAEVKHAYFEKTKLCHPDVTASNKESLKLFRQITEAYEVLGSPTLRKEYDENVLGISTPNADDFEDPIAAYKKKISNEKMYNWTKEHYNMLRKQQHTHHSFSYNSNKKPELDDKYPKFFELSLLGFLILFGIFYSVFSASSFKKAKQG